jgi:hypothetical protein
MQRCVCRIQCLSRLFFFEMGEFKRVRAIRIARGREEVSLHFACCLDLCTDMLGHSYFVEVRAGVVHIGGDKDGVIVSRVKYSSSNMST